MSVRILIIEDNPANLELMGYLLRCSGHEVLIATDGPEGLDCAQMEAPDLIICDIQMPRMTGFEVALHLKGNDQLKHIPLVAITAFAMVGDRERVLAGGFDGYLAKPIDPEAFVGQIEAFLLPNPSGKE